jgi:hypothetical protein
MVNAPDDKTELEALKARIEELERKAKPPEPAKPFVPGPMGPTTTELAMSRMSMPPSALAEVLKATPDGLMRDIMSDARRNSTLSPLGGEAPARERGTGWQTAQSLSNPPGVAIADRLMIAADAKERAEKIVADPKEFAKWKEGRKS